MTKSDLGFIKVNKAFCWVVLWKIIIFKFLDFFKSLHFGIMTVLAHFLTNLNLSTVCASPGIYIQVIFLYGSFFALASIATLHFIMVSMIRNTFDFFTINTTPFMDS